MVYRIFSLFGQSIPMDLSFTRRKNVPALRPATAKTLSSFLVEAAARQATTPTARAQVAVSANENPTFSKGTQFLALAPRDNGEAPATDTASFNPFVAATILTQCKPS